MFVIDSIGRFVIVMLDYDRRTPCLIGETIESLAWDDEFETVSFSWIETVLKNRNF